MTQPGLPHPGHNKHLCYLTNLHFHQTHWPEYKKLVEGAQYVCKLCGRSAADKDRLCRPVKL
jgi:hypothetical protein